MGNTSGAKYKHMLYNVSWARKKSGDKQKNAIEWYILILKKEAIQGATKRVQKTKAQAAQRLSKMGIPQAQIVKALEHKGLKDLIANIS